MDKNQGQIYLTVTTPPNQHENSSTFDTTPRNNSKYSSLDEDSRLETLRLSNSKNQFNSGPF